MKKRGWKLYRSPNPNPKGVRKCNSTRLGCPKCHPVLIDLGCPKCLSVGQRCHRLLLNVNDGWETFLNFPLIITSWAGLVRSELKLFFHPNSYSLILAKLKGTYSNIRNNKEKGHVSAKNLQFNNKSSNKSFILIKINRGSRIDHLMSPFVFDILKTFKTLKRFQDIPLWLNFGIYSSCKLIQKLPILPLL